MSKAASGAPLKIPMDAYEPPTDMNVNLKKHKGLDVHDVGNTVHFIGHGKVVSKAKSQNGGHTMRIEIAKLEPHKNKNYKETDTIGQ